jgi:hypothetical protein
MPFPGGALSLPRPPPLPSCASNRRGLLRPVLIALGLCLRLPNVTSPHPPPFPGRPDRYPASDRRRFDGPKLPWARAAALQGLSHAPIQLMDPRPFRRAQKVPDLSEGAAIAIAPLHGRWFSPRVIRCRPRQFAVVFPVVRL